MKFLLAGALVLLSSSSQNTKTYRFIGKYQAYDSFDGFFEYCFVGVSGKPKCFIQSDDWNPLEYNFESFTNRDKWFEIHYSGEYAPVVDPEEPIWYRRIKSIRIIPTPKSQDRPLQARLLLEDFGREAQTAWFGFINDGPEPEMIVGCDTACLNKLPFDFNDGTAFLKTYKRKWFNVTYSIQYDIDEKSLPVTRTIVALQAAD